MCACRILGYVLIGLLLTPPGVDAKKHSGITAEWIRFAAEDLSSSFFQSAKRNYASGLPPRIQLTIVLPSTTTVGARNFLLLKIFARKLVQEFSVSPSGTRVAMVTYSSNPRLAFSWDQYVNKECTLKAISSLRYAPGMRVPLDHLFNLLMRRLYFDLDRKKHTGRRILFIIAERSSPCSKMSAAPLARKLIDNGVEVIILKIGKHVNSSGRSRNIFQIGSFDDLSKLSHAFRGRGFNHSCSGFGIIYDECNRRCSCKDGRPTACHRVRKDFMEMPLVERRRYVRALKVVSMEAPYRKTYDYITKLHAKYFNIIHERNLFFPWHRWYIATFENLLRHVDCRVTVPYWNWPRAVSARRLWRYTDIRDIWNPGPHGLGANGDPRSLCVRTGPFRKGKWFLPFWHDYDCLSREFDRETPLPGEWYVKKLNKLPWSQFNIFETGVRDYMHNDLHNSVGGTMSEDESSLAPEFWSHHAFLDKIWSNWQDHGPKYKFAYFRRINKRLPGGTHYGWEFMDLQNQPHCVKALYDEPSEEKVPEGNETLPVKHRYGPESDESRCNNHSDCDTNEDDENVDVGYDRNSDVLDEEAR